MVSLTNSLRLREIVSAFSGSNHLPRMLTACRCLREPNLCCEILVAYG